MCRFVSVCSEDLGAILSITLVKCVRYIKKYSPYFVAIIKRFVYFASDRKLVDARVICLKTRVIICKVTFLELYRRLT